MACKYSDASSLACIVCDRREGGRGSIIIWVARWIIESTAERVDKLVS